MASSPTSQLDWVSVKTTLPVRPLPPNSSRPPAITDRLIIRALVPDDVHSLHVLRTQPEVMVNTAVGEIDKDLQETQAKLDLSLAPNDRKTFNVAICLKETGELIGIGGCLSVSSMFGWPEIGYMLRREFWGQGLMTEFLHAWLDMWSKLPREETEFKVDPRTLPGGDGPVQEQVTALTVADNFGSQRVLAKGGFEYSFTWSEPDTRNPTEDIELRLFRYFPTKGLKN
ncbi:uncharacterized protein DNG_06326 [Cephalotrichum gorgonifer]|uniref:N-acetyltransferase domain-containing protein n=1 Tax=Cephalotrichum gorgonifer TaxID=2041049 RepID=A0AAE8SWF4_9PEZI|nr:uncharacterized protein DNG_06326 [Cephalotrichum gorgonifer]